MTRARTREVEIYPDLHLLREEAERRSERIAATLERVEEQRRLLWERMDRLHDEMERTRPRGGTASTSRAPADAA